MGNDGRMAELADASDLKSGAERREGSSPSSATKYLEWYSHPSSVTKPRKCGVTLTMYESYAGVGVVAHDEDMAYEEFEVIAKGFLPAWGRVSLCLLFNPISFGDEKIGHAQLDLVNHNVADRSEGKKYLTLAMLVRGEDESSEDWLYRVRKTKRRFRLMLYRFKEPELILRKIEGDFSTVIF